MSAPDSYIVSVDEADISGESLLSVMKDVLAREKPFRFLARGYSMFPFIRDADVITVHAMTGISPSVGDVVAFIHPRNGRLVIHRLIKKSCDDYLVKGDNSVEPAEVASLEHIIGIIRAVERKGVRVIFGFGPEKKLIAFSSSVENDGFLLRNVRKYCRILLRRLAG
ncbi:S24/S26 family peptidase [bacterium]|nr:S24/S26 family peptidase [bacterium]